MDFKEVLFKALRDGGDLAADPFLLYSLISDQIGRDFELKKQASQFYLIDKEASIVKSLMNRPKPCVVGELRKKCTSQSKVSPKDCFRLISAVFEFYYRIKFSQNRATPKTKPEQKSAFAQSSFANRGAMGGICVANEKQSLSKSSTESKKPTSLQPSQTRQNPPKHKESLKKPTKEKSFKENIKNILSRPKKHTFPLWHTKK